MHLRNWSCLSAILTIAGCSWLSSPTTPQVNSPKQFDQAQLNYQSLESLPYLAWWQQFNDPKLNALIESGLKNNLDLEVALANLEQAQGQLRQVQLSWIPFINLYAGFSTNPAFGDIGTFYGAWPQYTINIAQVIKQQERANYNLEMNKAMVDGVRLTVIGQVSAGYFTLIAQQEQLLLLNKLNDDMNELIKILKQEVSIGLKDNVDLTGLMSQQQLIQAQISIATHNIVLSQNSLHYLLNQNPGSIKSTNNFAKLDFDKFKPGALPSTVLQNRPDLRMAEYAVKSAHAGVAVAYGSLFPSLQLDSFFGAGTGGGIVGNPTNYVPMQDAYMNWGINPSTFGEIEAQKGAYQAQVYRYIQTVRKILKDVDNDFSANRQYSNNYQSTQQSWKDLAEKYKLQQGLYQTGIMSYTQLLNAKIQLDNLALTVNQAKLQQAITVVNLYQDLAGGYKYQKPESTTSTTD
ncbi:MAG TPA: TolC family protein [Burkholderiales bacterium]|nr:TolC family protein [Burkholderiales bacterium]